jgi:polyhydroxyalkanoate synthase
MRHYLLGERSPMTDMLAWNADTTRMPYRMHADYLRRLYLGNDLAEGRYTVDGRPVSLGDIRQPIFCVGTVKDHVAPWRSVYKWIALTDTDVTFVLTEGGHNAGIISEPGHRHRSYRMSTHQEAQVHTDPDTWAMETPVRDGSWWPAWAGWLEERSGEPGAPPAMGAPDRGFAPLAPAPGLYVLGR